MSFDCSLQHGQWQHYTLPIKELADLFEDANGFDGFLYQRFPRHP